MAIERNLKEKDRKDGKCRGMGRIIGISTFAHCTRWVYLKISSM